MEILYERSRHYFSEEDRRMRRRKRERAVYLAVLIILILTFAAGLFMGNVLFSSARELTGDDTYKMFASVRIGAGETLYDAAYARYDEARYSGFDSYMAEVCLINHLMSPDEVRAGYYVILPYYGSN